MRDASQYPEITGLADAYGGIRIYSEMPFGRDDNPLREPAAVGQSMSNLSESLTDLPLVLNLMKRTAAHEQLVKLLGEVKETYRDYITEVVYGRVGLLLEEDPFRVPVPASRLSDGTLRFLVLAAVLLPEKLPPVICLEEPELGMHPDMIRMVGNMLIDAAPRTQLIVTTHSEHLLTALQSDFDVLFAMDAGVEGTIVRPFSQGQFKKWRADHRLGELWTSGFLGGQPMVKRRQVRMFIEGGADGRNAGGEFRRSWKNFLREVHDLARKHSFHSLEVIRGKSRSATFDLFKGGRDESPDDLCVLLIDSECAVATGTSSWQVVRTRTGDGWAKPDWCTDDHLLLMVQSVETWLITDHEALAKYFKKDFDPSKLPPMAQVTQFERRGKADIADALKNATKKCKRGEYSHGDGNAILYDVKPENVKLLLRGKLLFDTLAKLIVPKPTATTATVVPPTPPVAE